MTRTNKAAEVVADMVARPRNPRARPGDLPAAVATGAGVAGRPVVGQKPPLEVPNAAVAYFAYMSTHNAMVRLHGS
jgi:hypothetical protein